MRHVFAAMTITGAGFRVKHHKPSERARNNHAKQAPNPAPPAGIRTDDTAHPAAGRPAIPQSGTTW